MIANKENGMSARDNYYDLEVFKYKIDACCYVDDLNALLHGGRIPRAQPLSARYSTSNRLLLLRLTENYATGASSAE